ncbi:hypothetical protein SAMN05444157_1313 [Frankineae bacterium MT45]|nr:hypothetical protein SAMN05444157_1313 [Frankineae bacterium MT45]
MSTDTKCVHCGWRLRLRYPPGNPNGAFWVHAATNEVGCPKSTTQAEPANR